MIVYIPPHFEQPHTDELHRLVEAYPFGALVTHGPEGLDANHVPFELDTKTGAHGRLLAHVARANPVWREAAGGAEALVIFRAADAYISPNWYPSKHEAHRQVPTWNYRVVHVHGRLHARDDAKFLRGLVGRLAKAHERRAGEPQPWTMADADPAFIDGMLAAIVGLELEITRIVGKWKLGQNKDARDRLGAIDGLERGGHAEVAAAMRATLPPAG